MDYSVSLHISKSYISHFINSILPTSQHPYIQETTKIDTLFHFIYKKLSMYNGKHILHNGEYQSK